VRPACTAEGIGLSDPVARAIDEAVRLILDIVRREDRSGLDAE
jgi:hydrogenase maturation protease